MILDKISLSAVFLCAVTLLGGVSAFPSPEEYPEVIPGPGMPSLESLGLTSKDLYNAIEPENILTIFIVQEGLVPRFTRICTDNGCGRVPKADAQACINYLRGLGSKRCGVPHENIVMCRAGQAIVSGSNIRGGGEVSSACSDVATGGQGIINNCNWGGKIAGADAAYGNGDLIVSIEKC
ncbi:hypothetical protein M408DRAFT_79877 [Serendipita vermifera MAFF 305830]|uniref:Uncharacterized protein n=1 Tax=Serendipita vermifera MAFF 305830 TaxID=933852 RepID=A0A0C3ARG4_SERVB|nr:hypothetical protein M408DRAFT_79877 [Serendipita vermifera MAFF 305830]